MKLQDAEALLRRGGSGQSVKSDSYPNDESNHVAAILENKLNRQYNRYFRFIAVLIFILSLFSLIAVISYDSRDDMNANVTVTDLISLLRGNDEIRAKLDTTQNLLGIVGAIISDALINGTIGYFIIVLPLIMMLWSYSLFRFVNIGEKLLKRTILLLLTGITASTLITVFSPGIAREYGGSVGFLLSSIIAGFIGNVGAAIILSIMTLLILSALFGINRRKLTALAEFLKSIGFPKFHFPGKAKTVEEKKPFLSVNYDNSDNVSEEPAKIIMQNMNYDFKPYKFTPPVIREVPDFGDLNGKNRNNIKINRGIEPNPESAKSPEIIINKDKTAIKPDWLPKIERIIVEERPPHDSLSNYNTSSSKDNDSEISVGTLAGQPELNKPVASSENILDNLNNNNKSSVVVDSIYEVKEIQDNEREVISRNDTVELASFPKPEIIPTQSNIHKPLTVTVQEPGMEKSAVTSPISTILLDEEIEYIPPPVEILIDDDSETFADEEELRENARILQEKLETFRVYIENMSVTPGPVVTQYEFIPAAGIKISKIESFADDMAMALKARGIRIIAPIPGKGTVGIEIPNHKPSLVRFGSVVRSAKFQNTNHKLPLAFGKTISGEVFCTDLSKMPHLLIAGATGAGKSVGINTVIASLIYKLHPNSLKFVIIDPKKVELKQYSALETHFLAVSPDIDSSIICDPQDAVIALKAVCAEMDARYDILSRAGQRNILEYNIKVAEGKFKNDEELLHRPMPYIIVIIDELADLMLTASKEVETPIIRLAQLARAVGIHCVVATQRPSVDVITGIIKANFPARISYLVASKVDSRTILDVSGAEQLLGNGDMLFLAGGSPKPVRIQNAYISTDEVEEICDFIGNQHGYSQPYMLPSLSDNSKKEGSISREDRDPLFEQAARIVVQQQQASVSMIQRRLKVGYARAGRIVDELEFAGVIGPYDGSKARIVYIDSEEELNGIL